jgi:hypothetical protein
VGVEDPVGVEGVEEPVGVEEPAGGGVVERVGGVEREPWDFRRRFVDFYAFLIEFENTV